MASTISPAFARTHAVRIVSGVASAGALAAFSIAGAAPAMAATDADCLSLSDAGSFEFGSAALAATGVETTGWLGAAAALLLAGAALALVRTRRLLRLS